MPVITAEEKSIHSPQHDNIEKNHTPTPAKSLKDIRIEDDISRKYAGNLVVMKCNAQVKALKTIMRDYKTSRQDFIFHSDRLIRMVIEEGLNQLPFTDRIVNTHSGEEYKGCSFQKSICGVSIVRSGEAMEKGLRECCRSIRVGKILMTLDEDAQKRRVIYARFPPDIHKRKVLLMYPVLITGANATLGVETLLDYGVSEDNIYILSLFATPTSVDRLFSSYPSVRLLTTEVHQSVPLHFGDKYFGTG